MALRCAETACRRAALHAPIYFILHLHYGKNLSLSLSLSRRPHMLPHRTPVSGPLRTRRNAAPCARSSGSASMCKFLVALLGSLSCKAQLSSAVKAWHQMCCCVTRSGSAAHLVVSRCGPACQPMSCCQHQQCRIKLALTLWCCCPLTGGGGAGPQLRARPRRNQGDAG